MDYEKRIKAAYPIHPEIFDRLYTDWSTLLKFQRTRGVLRLMAAVIHCLWEKGDKNPLIMPANIPIDDPRVQFEMTRYLSDNWVPIIEKDVDGPDSLPLRVDAEVPNLGKFAAARRVARTIYLGSAPTADAAHHGIEDRRIKLGCVMPGESAAVFGDALRRLAGAATYLYQDGSHYWYSTQPTVTKLAEDRAEQLKREPDKIVQELDVRLRNDLKQKGDFERIHPFPHGGQDIPDDRDARLVVLGVDHPYSKEAGNEAEAEAKRILESRGSAPRLYRNSLIFLAADKARLQDLDEAARRYVAWKSIIDGKEQLNLSPFQVKQAEQQLKTADQTVNARLPETYQWILVPGQGTPQSAVEWHAIRTSGQEALAVRASKKLKSEEFLVLNFSPTRLKMELDRVPLWRGDDVAVKQLAEDFARYLYLPRLLSSKVLVQTIRDGLGLLTWEEDAFAWADERDDEAHRYRGLRIGQATSCSDPDSPGLLVKSEVALKQIERESKPVRVELNPDRVELCPSATFAFSLKAYDVDGRAVQATRALWSATSGTIDGTGLYGAGTDLGQFTIDVELQGLHARSIVVVSDTAEPRLPVVPAAPPVQKLKRFHGTVVLDAERVGRDAGRIAEEIISHLAVEAGSRVTVTLEIEAELPAGAGDGLVRTVTENARTLRFSSQGFERE